MVSNSKVESRQLAVISEFESRYGVAPDMVARAPGRVNLIGEHTDYNEGFVFPAAIDREMLIAASKTEKPEAEVYSIDYAQLVQFNLDDLNTRSQHQWVNYLRGVLKILRDAGYPICGFRAVLSGNVPQGAGLSSSAAYEVAVVKLMNHFGSVNMGLADIARLAQKAENEYIGVKCGIMDQFASAAGAVDSAIFLDCRSLEFKIVPLSLESLGASILVINSGVRRGLVDSEYNKRREECRQGVERFTRLMNRGVLNSLRDVCVADFDRYSTELSPIVAKRCKHVVYENQRVLDAVAALNSKDLAVFGSLMYESHESLRNDFQVSCPELDSIVDIARNQEGVFGARMTGAGFGGCVVALVKTDAIEPLRERLKRDYFDAFSKPEEVHICSAVDGASVSKH